MKLIEKKCPSCGGSLSFNDTDKSCRCEYCKKSFEIEREENKDVTGEYIYNLNNASKPFGIFIFIIVFLVFVFVVGIFAFVFYNMFN